MKKSKFNRPLTIAFEAKMFEQIKKYSDEEEISLGEWIRNSLAAYINGENCKLDKCNKKD